MRYSANEYVIYKDEITTEAVQSPLILLFTFAKVAKINEITLQINEILPYHTLRVFKRENLGIPYELGDVMPPTKEEIAHAEEILHTADYKDYAK